ncbi:MAG: hypothetical protein FWG25_03060, partial [Promicromonosporaceae bacterium]|nr:hypothetical protein [Promicromonosporaceae bacterium]
AGNVHDAAGNYVGRAGEVVAEPDGTVVNTAGQVVGQTAGEPIADATYDGYGRREPRDFAFNDGRLPPINDGLPVVDDDTVV